MWTKSSMYHTANSIAWVFFLVLPIAISAFKVQWSKANDRSNENEVLPRSYLGYRSVYKPSTMGRPYNYDWSLKKYLRTDNSYSSKSRYRHWRPVAQSYEPYINEPAQEAQVVEEVVPEQQEEPLEQVLEDTLLNQLIKKPEPPKCSKMYCDSRECCNGICTHVFGSNLCLLLPGQYRR